MPQDDHHHGAAELEALVGRLLDACRATDHPAGDVLAGELEDTRARLAARRIAAGVLRPLLDAGALEPYRETTGAPLDAVRAELARILEHLETGADVIHLAARDETP